MITRRRGRNNNNYVDVQTSNSSLEVEVGDMSEEVKTSLLDVLQTENVDSPELVLDDLLGIDELNWTLEGDAVSSLFDMRLTEFGAGDSAYEDSEMGASLSPSPERVSEGGAQKRKRQEDDLSGRMIVNKNAVNARLNRQKKKEYVSGLEKTVGSLSTENRSLKQENDQLSKRVEDLEDETRDPMTVTMTMPCPENELRWRRKKRRVACVYTWTGTTSPWSSAKNVRRVQALQSKCRVKYLKTFSDVETELVVDFRVTCLEGRLYDHN